MTARAWRHLGGFAAAVTALALAMSAPASAAVRLSPPIVAAKESQLFTLVVEPEKEDVLLKTVELYAPPDFKIDSFAPSEGWEREWTIQSGKTLIQKATWTREEEPMDEEEIEEATEQDAIFQFVAHPESSKTHAFEVRQWYSDGSAIHWRGAESVAFPPNPPGAFIRPAPTLVAKSSLGGGGRGETLAIVALIVGGLGVVAATVALARGARRGPRS